MAWFRFHPAQASGTGVKLSSDWTLAPQAGPDHVAWAQEGGYLLGASEWASVVSALGADPLFAWNLRMQAGLVIPVFKRHGLRVGFLGFPVVGSPWGRLEHGALTLICRDIARGSGLDMVRVNHAMQLDLDDDASSGRPEAWIDDLQSWSVGRGKKRRRDVAYALRAAGQMEFTEVADPFVCQALYAETVRAYAGPLRYSVEYFSRLVELSKRLDQVSIFSAKDPSGLVRAFAAMLIDGKIAHYLHGAAVDSGKRMGLSDLLLERMTTRARELGATRLSLMSSPWTQPGLTRFKRKWGDALGLTVTSDVAGTAKGAVAGWASRWLLRGDRAHAAKFRAGGAK